MHNDMAGPEFVLERGPLIEFKILVFAVEFEGSGAHTLPVWNALTASDTGRLFATKRGYAA